MHDIVALKDMLCEELEEYGRKGEMSAGTLEIVDKLAHAVKNIGKIIEMYEDEEYSSAYGGNMNGGSYRGGNRSYARGRGRNVRRDSMGRYSGDAEELVEQLEDMMDSAPDEQTRMELKRLVKKMKSM